jgi:thymidylate kinase
MMTISPGPGPSATLTASAAQGTGGLLVALEGIDGGGKTTAARTAAGMLRAEGYAAVAADRAGMAGPSAYAAGHMAGLRTLIWDEPPDAPYLELGDEHWVLLQAAWYCSFARCVVAPLLAAGHVVIADTWGYKFLAKLQLRPPAMIRADWALGIFDALAQPGLIVHLRADPARAAARKTVLSGSETGHGDGVPPSGAAFEAYQRRLGQVLERFARERGWASLDVSALTVTETGAALAGVIRDHLDGRAAPAAADTGMARR